MCGGPGPPYGRAMADDLVMWAGPILRRVEPRLVTVWVALDRPCKLLLTVFPGPGQAAVATGAATTLRLGEKLHIGVVVAEPTVPLNPGHNYRYDVGFQPQPSVPDAAVLQPADGDADRDAGHARAAGRRNGQRPPAQGARLRRRRAARVRAAADRAHRPADPARQLPPPRLHLRRHRRARPATTGSPSSTT